MFVLHIHTHNFQNQSSTLVYVGVSSYTWFRQKTSLATSGTNGTAQLEKRGVA